MKRRDDEGVAALELALLITTMLALFALVAPLGYLFYERVQLGRSAGDLVRFTTSRTDRVRLVTPFDGTGAVRFTVPAQQLPGPDAVAAEAEHAYTGRGTLLGRPGVVRTPDLHCPSGFRVTVSLSTEVDIGPFLGLVTSGSFTSGNTETLLATASSCEE